MLKRLVMVLVLAGALVFAAGASASARDRNNDRIPDRWEKKHDLSLEVKQTWRDQDHDGLKNRGEWRAHTDPRDTDSDEDGIEDGDENAGTVTAYANGVLTITMFAGGELVTASVTAETEVECDVDDESVADASGNHPDPGEEAEDEDEGEHSGDEPGDSEDESEEDEVEEHGEHHDDDGEECAAGALKVGALVEEAELKVSSTGKVWTEIELRK